MSKTNESNQFKKDIQELRDDSDRSSEGISIQSFSNSNQITTSTDSTNYIPILPPRERTALLFDDDDDDSVNFFNQSNEYTQEAVFIYFTF